jgi:hypothetical protein
VAVGIATALGAAVPASANTATIGSDLSQFPDANSCVAPCLAVQLSQVGGSSPHSLTSPANGVVTEWAIRSSDNVTNAFRILRPAGTNTYLGVSTSLGVDPRPPGEPIVRYPVSLPIAQGDAIGISAVAGDSDVGIPQHNTPGENANVWARNALGQPTDGASATFTPEVGHELLLQATIEYCAVPNLKRLKKVAAKQRLAAADCGVKVKKRTTRKRKFRGKVLKQKVPAGTTGPPGTVIPVVIGQK